MQYGSPQRTNSCSQAKSYHSTTVIVIAKRAVKANMTFWGNRLRSIWAEILIGGILRSLSNCHTNHPKDSLQSLGWLNTDEFYFRLFKRVFSFSEGKRPVKCYLLHAAVVGHTTNRFDPFEKIIVEEKIKNIYWTSITSPNTAFKDLNSWKVVK